MMEFPKSKAIRSKKIRESAKGQQCTFRGPTCNNDPETTVLCHLNSSSAGKGMSRKADDLFVFYGCSNCHSLYDGRMSPSIGREEHRDIVILAFFAHTRTLRKLYDQGLIKIDEDKIK